MITGPLKYGGVVGKTIGIYSKRITPAEFYDMKQKVSSSEIISLLKSHSGYSEALGGFSDRNFDREKLETTLEYIPHTDFAKIYAYTSKKDRSLLQYFIMQNEINHIMKYIRLILANSTKSYDYTPIPLVKRLSVVDFSAFTTAQTLIEFIDLLGKTPYYDVLLPYRREGIPNYTHIEVSLYTYYYETLFGLIKKYTSGKTRKELMAFTQTLVDLKNFTNILRCVAIGQDRKSIYAYLLPFSSDDIANKLASDMINAPSYKESLALLRASRYGIYLKSDDDEGGEDEYVKLFLLEYIYKYSNNILKSQKPSICLVYAYLSYKDIEVKNIIHLLEGKIYGLLNEEIDQYLIVNKKTR